MVIWSFHPCYKMFCWTEILPLVPNVHCLCSTHHTQLAAASVEVQNRASHEQMSLQVNCVEAFLSLYSGVMITHQCHLKPKRIINERGAAQTFPTAKYFLSQHH